MNTKEAAALLNGREYTKEITRDEEAAFKAAGLVALFGASDDLAEFRGAFHDEAYPGGDGEIYITPRGLFAPSCDNDDCPHEKTARKHASVIKALWCEEPDISWTYSTALPHETFNIMEDGEIYCRGIVFNLDDAQW